MPIDENKTPDETNSQPSSQPTPIDTNPIPGNVKWPKGTSGNPNGRPRKLTQDIIAMMLQLGIKPLKPIEIVDAYEVLINAKRSDLEHLAGDADVAMFIKIIAKGILSNKNLEVLEMMLNRAHGKPKQSLNVDGSIQTSATDLTGFTFDQLMKLKHGPDA